MGVHGVLRCTCYRLQVTAVGSPLQGTRGLDAFPTIPLLVSSAPCLAADRTVRELHMPRRPRLPSQRPQAGLIRPTSSRLRVGPRSLDSYSLIGVGVTV